MAWTLYVVECADSTYYTGITNDLERRIAQHNAGTGAKYTQGRAPVRLVYTELFESRSLASRREYEIKALTRREKRTLVMSACSGVSV